MELKWRQVNLIINSRVTKETDKEKEHIQETKNMSKKHNKTKHNSDSYINCILSEFAIIHPS